MEEVNKEDVKPDTIEKKVDNQKINMGMNWKEKKVV